LTTLVDQSLRTENTGQVAAICVAPEWNVAMERRVSQRAQLHGQQICVALRTYRGASGQTYHEIHRTESTVTLLPEYPVSRIDTLTIPLAMLETFFVQV
jgi:hypothetical protein